MASDCLPCSHNLPADRCTSCKGIRCECMFLPPLCPVHHTPDTFSDQRQKADKRRHSIQRQLRAAAAAGFLQCMTCTHVKGFPQAFRARHDKVSLTCTECLEKRSLRKIENG